MWKKEQKTKTETTPSKQNEVSSNSQHLKHVLPTWGLKKNTYKHLPYCKKFQVRMQLIMAEEGESVHIMRAPWECHGYILKDLHPRNSTWNPKIMHSQRILLFHMTLLRLLVKTHGFSGWFTVHIYWDDHAWNINAALRGGTYPHHPKCNKLHFYTYPRA